MKIKNKIISSFLLTFIVVSSLIGLMVGLYTTDLLKKEFYSYMISSNQSKAEHIRTFLIDQEKTSIILAAASIYRDFLKEPTKTSQYKIIKEKIDKRLIRTLKADPLIDEAFILDRNGQVLASSDKTQEGADKSKDDYFLKAQSKTFIKDVYYSDFVNKLNYTISSPILDDNNDFLGVSVLRYLPENFFSIVENRNKIVNSEENFLINSDRYFITPSLFLGEEAILKRKADTVNAEGCFEPEEVEYVTKYGYAGLIETLSHGIVDAKDYRGIDIKGTHSYIPETGWCLITKADVSDIMAFRYWLIIIFTSIFTGAAIVFLFIGNFISKKITDPLHILQSGVEKVKKGFFGNKVDVNSKDEIGDLASSFNIMSEAVKESRTDIENKVKEQTKELNAKTEKLEDQKLAIMNILEDVEEEKKKTEEFARDLEKFKMAVSNSSDHIVITDNDGIVLYANEAVHRITGFSLDEVMGKKAGNKDLWGGLMEKEFYEKFWRTIKIDKQSFQGEVKNKRKNGEFYEASVNISPVLNKNGDVIFFVGIERDVTKAKEVDRMKTEFISLASHQLRTPLSAMKWFGEMLLNGDAGKLTEEQTDFVSKIYESNQKMINLVNGLLNISRIESGRIVIDPKLTDLFKLVEEVLIELKPKIDTKKIKIIKSLNQKIPPINVDPQLTREVYSNLLSNAVKYTPEGGEITIFISDKEDEIISQISDTGYGIPKAEQEKLFSKFYRGSNIVKIETDGNGLGMYIIKSIIESSQGKIWFESEENKGTTFWFTLPKKGVQPKKGNIKLNS